MGWSDGAFVCASLRYLLRRAQAGILCGWSLTEPSPVSAGIHHRLFSRRPPSLSTSTSPSSACASPWLSEQSHLVEEQWWCDLWCQLGPAAPPLSPIKRFNSWGGGDLQSCHIFNLDVISDWGRFYYLHSHNMHVPQSANDFHLHQAKHPRSHRQITRTSHDTKNKRSTHILNPCPHINLQDSKTSLW